MTLALELLDKYHEAEREKRSGEAFLVIFKSADGKTGWSPVKPEDVPEWVKTPVHIGRIMNGEMVSSGDGWYVAAKAADLQPAQVDGDIQVPEVRIATQSETSKYAS
jgi:hypothetical protein